VEKLDRLAMLSTDIYLSHATSETRLRHLRALIERSKAQAKALAHVRSALPAGSGATAALLQVQEDLLTSTREVRRGLQDLLRTERDELLRTGHSVVELRERVRELQMLPVSTLFDLYPRVVRDLAKDLGKQVRLVVEGADVELDRRVIDDLRDPMVHLIRNAIDHGIEPPDVRRAAGKPPQGTLTLAARTEGDRAIVEVRDDGAGIDADAIRRVAVRRGVLDEVEAAALGDERAIDLIFAPGFSSRETVTDVSGRGVGLDVVRDRVDRLEGSLSVWSQPGRGTRFELRVPLSVAVARLILVRGGGLLLSLPAALVDEVLRVPEEGVSRVEGYEAMTWKDRALPLVSLAGLLEREPEPVDTQHRHVAVVRFEDHAVGLVVDAFAGEREAVVKPLDDFLGRIPHVAGATILTTGEVVAVLHVPQLIASSMGVAPGRLQARVRVTESPPSKSRRRLLVVDDSIIVRDMMKGVLEQAGFDVTLAVDGADGLEKQLAGGYDAVVTDVEMPRMTGFELTRALRTNPAMAALPIVMVTTLDAQEAREEGMRSGASAYLVKNLLDMSQLVGTIERLLG
jgi:chemotaxis protein histidine kinase CheA